MYKLVIFNKEHFKSVVNFGGEYIYVENKKRTLDDKKIRDKMAIQLITSSIKIMSLFNISLILMMAVPAFLIVILRQNQLIIPVIIPFIDPDTEFGYNVNMINQLLFSMLGFTALAGIELGTCTIKNCVISSAAVIKFNLSELDKKLQTNSEFTVERAHELRNSIVQIQDFDRFGFKSIKCIKLNRIKLIKNI